MRTVRSFFERIIEWDWPDAPPRNPVIAWDIPKKPEPLPKFPGDRDAARLMAAARAATDPRDRLVMELLARTGMRAGELAGLEADAVVLIGTAHWLRIPLGKLRNDTYVPLHPKLTALLSTWTAANLEHIRRHKLLVADHRGPLDATASAASSPVSPARPVSRASTRTGCATPWPPRRSTAACASRPSPRSWATRRWR
jgi:integrase